VFAEYFPPYMGSDRRIFDLVSHVRDWSFEFAVVPPLRILGGRCEEALAEYFQRHFIDGIVEDESGGIHGHYFLLPPQLMRAWRSLPLPVAYAMTLPYLAARAAKYLRAQKPDIVVVAHPSYLCGAVGLLAAHAAGIPAVLDYPDAWTPLAVETACIDPNGATARILRTLEAAIARSAKRIVSITAGLERYVRGLGAACPIDIVPNGADDARFGAAIPSARTTLGYEDGDEVILYSGRLEPWSGVHEIVEAIAKVCATRPRARFLFVGDGSAAGQLLEELSARGLENRVQCLGFQRYARMPELIAAADIAIVPFPHTPTTEVCSPVKLFEYLLMRKPVITTDLPGVREAVDERHVAFVRDLSRDQLGGAILELLQDAQRRENLRKAGYERCVQHFVWPVLAAKFSQSMSAACTPLVRR
jgi:glycosyltransferase involved in cell wall biosynthesis